MTILSKLSHVTIFRGFNAIDRTATGPNLTMDAEPLFTDLHTILDILKYINYTEKLKESLPTVIGIFLVQDINSFLKDFFS